MRRFVFVLCCLAACLPEPGIAPSLDAGAPVAPYDAGQTVGPPPPPPVVDGGPRDVGFGTLSLEAVNPPEGPATGGTRVQLRGEGFLPDSVVELGGQPVRDLMVVSARVLTFFAPAGAVGPADLRVQNAFGEATMEGAYTYFQPLQPRHMEPTEGPLDGGTTITVVGEGLSDETVVLIAGRVLLNTRMEGEDLIGELPPGVESGPADVRIADSFGQTLWSAAFTYLPRPVVEAVSPSRVGPGSTQTISLRGRELCAEPTILVGGQPCAAAGGDGAEQRCTLQAPNAEGMLELRLSCPGGESVLPEAVAVLAEEGPPLLLGLRPSAQAVPGGESVTVIGRGLSAEALRWDDQPAVGFQASPEGLVGMAPLRQQSGRVDVAVADMRIERAFWYRPAGPEITAMMPENGPASGGQELRVTGLGFCADAAVFLGGLPQEVVANSEREVTVRTGPHPGGPVDVELRCPWGSARLPEGYRYEVESSVLGYSPRRGAVAGGTEVHLVGRGLSWPDLVITFGGQPALEQEVISDQLMRLKAPAAAQSGVVSVAMTRAGFPAIDLGPFTYFEPAFRYGGSRGGTPNGSINVTVLNSWAQLAPVEGATVVVGGTRHDQRWVAETDPRGQVTISDPALVGPQTVTVHMAGCDQTRTMVDVDAADLTFWLGCPVSPPEGEGGGEMPPPPEPLIVSGRITGFHKALFDPGTLGPDERAFAQVLLTQSVPYGSGRRAGGQDFVFEDGGTYRLVLASGRYTLVAVAGVHNRRTQQVSRLTQLGFRRQVNGPPGEHLVDQDIELSYPMDAQFGVSLGDRLMPLNDQRLANRMRVEVALDFGGEGFFPLASEISRSSFILLRDLPRVPAGLLYVAGGLVTSDGGTSPSSTVRLRGNGEMEGGITLGPLMPLAEPLSPSQMGGPVLDRTLRWKYATGPIQPDYQKVVLRDGEGNRWELMLRGGQNKLRLPLLPAGAMGIGVPGTYTAEISAMGDPRFNFDNFSYLDTWYMTWQAQSQRSIVFELP